MDSMVSVKTSVPESVPSLNAAERLAKLAYDDMRRVDALILERLDSHVELIPELAKYLIEAGGKRVRPMITVAAGNLLGYTE
ncbi:MAG: polyprenyl synthetase family protein, partial [Maricaulis sp.]|nr:polyprenyl synthetase family protein [Maricaulis sp.]